MSCTYSYIHVCFTDLDLTDHGWCREDDQLKVVWDSPDNVKQVQKTIEFLTQGCKCKTGCSTRHRKCKKGGTQCGPSCRCVNCQNTPMYTAQIEEIQEEIQEEIEQEQDKNDSEATSEGEISYDEEERLNELNRDVGMIMEEVFGVPF